MAEISSHSCIALQNLTNTLVKQSFSYIPTKDVLITLNCVNRQWRKYCTEKQTWQNSILHFPLRSPQLRYTTTVLDNSIQLIIRYPYLKSLILSVRDNYYTTGDDNSGHRELNIDQFKLIFTLKYLTSIRLADLILPNDISLFHTLENLNTLTFSSLHAPIILSRDQMNVIVNLPHLHTLNLFYIQFGPMSSSEQDCFRLLKCSSSISSLLIKCCTTSISDAHIKTIAFMPNLKYLGIFQCSAISKVGLTYLSRLRNQLILLRTDVYLSKNRFSYELEYRTISVL